MCSLMGALGSTMAIGGSAYNMGSGLFNQGAMNRAVRNAYNQQLELARKRYHTQDFQTAEKTASNLQGSRQEEFRQKLELLRGQSSTEAAQASLGMEGNSVNRSAAVDAVKSAILDGAFDAREDNILSQHYADTSGNQENFIAAAEQAKGNAMSQWRNVTPNWMESSINLMTGGITGYATGDYFGDKTGVDKWFTGLFKKPGQNQFPFQVPTANRTGLTIGYGDGGW